jgi:hypothetical protein
MPRRGRPRLYEKSRHLHLTMEVDAHKKLAGPMLADFREQRPGANFNDFLRHLLDGAIDAWTRGRTGRNRHRRQELVKAATSAEKAVGRLVEMTKGSAIAL